jgi:hypothetical protein
MTIMPMNLMVDVAKTTIQIERNTVKRLAKYGNFHSTYDTILVDLLDHVENCKLAKIRG